MPWAGEMYPNANWTFQRDGTTVHMANLTEKLCRDIVLNLSANKNGHNFF